MSIRIVFAVCLAVASFIPFAYTSVVTTSSNDDDASSSTDNNIFVVKEGQPMIGNVAYGKYKYYQYVVPNQDLNSKDIHIDLLPTVGDADIFVECYLTATGTDVGVPSKAKGHNLWSSQKFGEDKVVISATDTHLCDSTYYISVYGYSTDAPAQYSLTVMHTGGVVSLVAGLPQLGSIFKDDGALFKYRLGKEAEEVKIELTTYTGDADIFVKLGKETTASTENYDYLSNVRGQAPDTVVISEKDVTGVNVISIYVYGYLTTTFSIVITLTDTTLQLTDGSPLIGSVAAGCIQYYEVTAGSHGSEFAILTIFSGDPTLYISKTVQHPNANSHSGSSDTSTSAGVPHVVVEGIDPGNTLYIGIDGGDTNSTYTIRSNSVAVNTVSLLTLLDGIPQSDVIGFHDPTWKYYKFDVDVGHEVIEMHLSQIVGQVDVYVSKCPSQSSIDCIGGTSSASSHLPTVTDYLYSTTNQQNDIIQVERNDDTKCSYIIGVNSLSMYVTYQINVALESSILALQPGIGVMDHVSTGDYDYFSYYVNSNDEALKITLTPLSGDPDMYVSTTDRHPGPDSYTWHSFAYGSEVIQIDTSTDLRACNKCQYYIAVYGAKESYYSIMVSYDSTTPRLSDGLPLTDTAIYMDYSYYTYTYAYGTTRDITINLASNIGNSNLYVTLDGRKPDIFDSDYSSAAFVGDDEVKIFHDDIQFLDNKCDDTAGCLIRIAVYCLSVLNDCQYTLSLTTSLDATMLQLGTSVAGSVQASGSAYYKVALNQESGDYLLRLSINLLNGNVNVYLSCSLYTDTDSRLMPSADNYVWMFNPDSTSSYDISSNAIADKGCTDDRSSTSSLYITVTSSAVSSASYYILAKYDDDSIIRLAPLHLYSGNVIPHSMDYYYIVPTTDYVDIKVTLTNIKGKADIYFSTTYETKPYYVSKSDKVMSYVQSTAGVGDNEIRITHNSIFKYCKDRDYCYFVVGIYGADTSVDTNDYRLQLSHLDSTITLTNGVPFRTTVADYMMQYFRYLVVSSDSDVAITLSSLSGDPDLFIGTSAKYYPTRYNYTWAAARYGSDSITIQAEELSRYCSKGRVDQNDCFLYAGVFGWVNSTFTITASIDNGFLLPTRLLNGQPQSGTVATNSFKYYKYVISSTVSVSFDLTPSDDCDIDVYIKFAPATATSDDYEPGKNNYDYKSVGWSSVSEEIRITAAMLPSYCSISSGVNCIVYIAIFGFIGGDYALSATPMDTTTVLQAGVATGGHVSSGGFKYYSYSNKDDFAEITIYVTAIDGDSDIYVAKRDTSTKGDNFPTKGNFVWRSFHWGDDSLSISYKDDDFCYNCDYIIGVYGNGNASYTILLSEAEATTIQLSLNRPQLINLKANTIKYFSVGIANSADDIVFSTTPMNGGLATIYAQVYNASTYISTTSIPDPAVASSYTYTTSGTTKNTIVIAGPHAVNSIIVTAVVSTTEISATILASVSGKLILLQSGVSQSGFVSQNSMEYFNYYVSDNNIEDLMISVTARTGDPDILITSATDSSDVALPTCMTDSKTSMVTCDKYTWMSNMYSTDEIIISRDYPCMSILPSTKVSELCVPETSFKPDLQGFHIIIGIFAYRDSTFSILAAPSGERIQLLPGQPQATKTYKGFTCTRRSNENGACLDTSAVKSEVQIAYFSFSVSKPGDIAITVTPNCNSTADSSIVCNPGCACDPLIISINSCNTYMCKNSDMYPSVLPNQNKYQSYVDSAGTTVFISEMSGTLYCNPEKNDCQYFISVVRSRQGMTSRPISTAATFTIVATTESDVALIPCGSTSTPDGYRQSIKDGIFSSVGYRRYEVCASGSTADSLEVSLEQCTTQSVSTIYACSSTDNCQDIFPTTSSWTSYADESEYCARSYSPKTKAFTDKKCTVDSNNNRYHHVPTLTLPLLPSSSNYFMTVNGTGEYFIRVANTINGGMNASPMILQQGRQGEGGVLSLSSLHRGNTVTITWSQSYILMPGVGAPLFAQYLKYYVYTIDKPVAFSNQIYTKCGLEYIQKTYPASITEYVVDASAFSSDDLTIAHTLSNLPEKKSLSVVLMAVCDSLCLHQLSKTSDGQRSKVSCGISTETKCQLQYFIYNHADIKTSSSSSGGADDATRSSGSGLNFITKLSILTVIIVIISIAMLAYKWRKMRAIDGDMSAGHQYEMVDIVNFFSSSSSGSSGSGVGNTKPASGSSNKFSISDDASSADAGNTNLIEKKSSTYMPPAIGELGNKLKNKFTDTMNSINSRMKQQQQYKGSNVNYTSLDSDNFDDEDGYAL